MRWIVLVLAAGLASAQTVADVRRGFESPPDDARIMMRWWWFGPAVSKPELEREMRLMREGGIGGFEVQPVYPLKVDGNLPYLSPEFLEDLGFTAAKARELGLRFDLTLASGWPYGGPHVPITQAAGRLRVEHGVTPKLTEGETLIGQAEAGGTTYYFISSRTRQQVKRAAVGAEGFVLDHYDPAAIANHLQSVADRLLAAVGPNRPYAVFSDSLEVYGSDWTPKFLEEFRERRGYDLRPYLAALVTDIGPKTMAIRHDWGKTLSELADANYLTPIREWAARRGTRFRSQTYGIPPVTLSSNVLVDLPEGEGWQWRRFSTTRWAASASHLYGKPVTSSETWTWLHSPVFRATPLDMKAEADLHFLQGVNQLIGHGWPYSPPEAGEPGQRFYAAGVFNAHNPWWIVMPDIARYLQRVSWLLRQGQPVRDVAVYLPTDDAFASFTLGHVSVNQAMDRLIGPNVIPQILDAGYNFDFIDDRAIEKIGVPYKILVLPGVERMPLATLQKIVASGATVIATRRAPSLAPGLMEQGDITKIRELTRKMTVEPDESRLGALINYWLKRDLTAAPEIGFVHRHLADGEIYFLVNTSNHSVKTTVTFRDSSRPQMWDPLTGRVAAYVTKPLEFAPYESWVAVDTGHGFLGGLDIPAAHTTEKTLSGWRVTFGTDSPPAAMSELRSWTELNGRKNFSGVATYETTLRIDDVSAGRVLTFGEGTPPIAEERNAGSGMQAMLDAPVREAAIVYVNGKRAGSVWCPPYEVGITEFVHTGENSIRIVVANSALNELAKGPLPDYKALNAKYGERFQPQDMDQVVPQLSGLLGPVRLITVQGIPR